MENLRWGNRNMVRVWKEPFDKDEGQPLEQIYLPEFPEHHAEATAAGHGGGDFFMNYHFAQAIRKNEQPYLDVYRGVTMSIVGILAYRSALADAEPVKVPDLRKKSVRDQYADDDWSPDPSKHRPGQPLPSVLGDIKPPPEGLACARKIWQEIGYTGE